MSNVCLHSAFNSIKAPKTEAPEASAKASEKRNALIFLHRHTSLCVIPRLPLGAVGMAGMTLVVGLGVLEDETVGALQPIGALLHAVGSIFEVEAFYTLVRALRGEENKEGEGG